MAGASVGPRCAAGWKKWGRMMGNRWCNRRKRKGTGWGEERDNCCAGSISYYLLNYYVKFHGNGEPHPAKNSDPEGVIKKILSHVQYEAVSSTAASYLMINEK